MYINPNTDIRLLRGCPCDPQHIHTLYFASAGAQSSYFMSLTKYNLNSYTYQRYAKGVLRVQILADNLYDINYMMFRNTAFGNKWFYAFVDKVEYINDVTTEITYHIDEIQTWLFDFKFHECFVERQHSTTDVIGDNIVVEPVETGEYVYNNYSEINEFSDMAIIVAIADVGEDSTYIADGNVYDGIYGACQLFAYSADTTGVQLINAKINEYAEAPDAITGIYMIPKDLIERATNGNYTRINTNTKLPYGSSGIASKGKTLDDVGSNLDGYYPKNKKLFTYPYNFQNVSTGEGQSLALRYEFFKDLTARVNIIGNISQPVQLVCCPTNYKGVNRADGSLSQYPTYVDEKIALTGYPMCSWNIDTWRAWVSQNAMPMIISSVSTGASLALASYTPAVTSEVTSALVSATGQAMTQTQTTPASINPDKLVSSMGIHKIANDLTSMYKASIAADQTKGNLASANALFAQGEYNFHHGRMSVNAQQAEIIDNFFTRFGYAVNKITTPNIHARSVWTYVKTIDCTIEGNLPSDSEHTIEQIFNKGVTFWANPALVGNYDHVNATL